MLEHNFYICYTLPGGGFIGPFAIKTCEPRQAWKGAAVATFLCAGVWLISLPPFISLKYLVPSS